MSSMADNNGSSSDLSDSESLWSPPSSERISYEEIVAGNEYKEVKDKLQSSLVSQIKPRLGQDSLIILKDTPLLSSNYRSSTVVFIVWNSPAR